MLEEALAVLRAAGGRWLIVEALRELGLLALWQGDHARAQALVDEGLAVAGELGAPDARGMLWSVEAGVAVWQGDLARATALWEADLARDRVREDRHGMAWGLLWLGHLARARGEAAPARSLVEESLALFTALGVSGGVASALEALGLVALDQGEGGRAAALLRQGLGLEWALGDRRSSAMALERLARALAGQGQHPAAAIRAVRLLGAAAALRQAIGAPRSPLERPDYEATVQAAQAALGAAAFAEAWAAGQALTPEQAMAEALEVTGGAAPIDGMPHRP